MILPLISVFIFSFLFLLFNELEDEVVRDRSRNNPTKVIKWYSKIKNIQLTSGANAKWYEPFERYNGKYYPKFMEKPIRRERFMFSSTMFVFITDLEHWYQWLKLRMVTLAIAAVGFMFTWYVALILLIVSQGGLFAFSLLKESLLKKLN